MGARFGDNGLLVFRAARSGYGARGLGGRALVERHSRVCAITRYQAAFPRLDLAGRQRVRRRFGQRGFGGVSLSPDGRRAAISIGDGPDAAIYIADAVAER